MKWQEFGGPGAIRAPRTALTIHFLWVHFVAAGLLVVAPDQPAAADDGNPPAEVFSLTQVKRIGSTRFRHGAAIGNLWFPANDRVVSGGGWKLRLWHAESGELKNEVPCPRSRPAFDGTRRVLIAEPLVNGVPTQAFRVVDLVSGQQVSRWLHAEWTESSAISRGGKFVVLGNLAHTVSLVDAQNGREIDRIEQLAPRGKAASYPMVALSPNNRILVVRARPGVAQFFELTAEGKVHRRLATIDNREFHQLVFSPSPDQVLLIGSRSSSIYNVRTAQQIARWNEPDANPVSDAVFARDGRVVAELTALPGMVRVRDTETGEELRNLQLNAEPHCYRIALSPDESVLAAGGYQERIRMVDFGTGKEIRYAADRETLGPAESAVVSDDGAWIASAEFKGVVSLWNRQDGWKRTVLSDDDIRSRFTYDTHAGPNFLTFLPGTTKLFAGSGIHHNSLNLWDAATAARDRRFVGHASPVFGVAASRDGAVLASSSRDGTLRIWNREGKQLHSIRAAGRSLSLSPDGALVAVSLQRQGPLRANGGIPVPSPPVPAVELWSTTTGMLVRSLEVTASRDISYGFYSVSFSHDGRLVAGIADEGLHVWDATTGKRTRLIPLPHPAADETAWHAPTCGCAFSPTENIIAVPTAAGSIVFFDVASEGNTPVATVQGHDGPVNSVSWRRDGQYVVSAGNDSTIVLWRVETGM